MQNGGWPIRNLRVRATVFLMAITVLMRPSFLRAQVVDTSRQRTVKISTPGYGKRFGRAALELALGEAIPWLTDDYLWKESWANISFKTIGNNIKPSSWAWDNDQFQVNQIGHPFHGSIYYNAFRANGYTFWRSVPAAFAGSYVWETLGETQAPSINDFINTSVGGVMLGEAIHRMSSKLVNSRSRGLKRQASEIFAMLINPSNGLNRLLDGKWGKVRESAGEQDTTTLSAAVEFGMRKFNVNNKNPFQSGRFGTYGRLRLSYGSAGSNLKDAFSNIMVTIEAGKDDSSKLNMVNIYGSLTGWKIYGQNNTQLAVLSANYDYINNEAFFYSAESIRINLFSEFKLSRGLKLNTAIGTGGLILAAIPDEYTYNSRDYDYGPGISWYGHLKMTYSRIFFFDVTYRGGWIATVNGNTSIYLLNGLTTNLGFTVINRLSITAEEGYFNLHGRYRKFQPVNKTYPFLKFALRYDLAL